MDSAPEIIPALMQLIFATNNAHKVAEIRSCLPQQITVLSLAEAGVNIEIAEPFNTLHENAAEKARVIYNRTGLDCFSDDSGLEVADLNGAPGVRSARFAGEAATAAENNAKLMGFLKSFDDRRAHFRTVSCLLQAGSLHYFEGVCPGRIAAAPAGTEGFGYDPLFTPDGAAKTFGEMTRDEKSRYSHRRQALDKLVAFLNHTV